MVRTKPTTTGGETSQTSKQEARMAHMLNYSWSHQYELMCSLTYIHMYVHACPHSCISLLCQLGSPKSNDTPVNSNKQGQHPDLPF